MSALIWIEVMESFQGDEILVSATRGDRTLRRRLDRNACEADPMLVKNTADELGERLRDPSGQEANHQQ
jgi:hypothetical protein